MFAHCAPEEAGVRSEGIVRFLDEMKEKHLHMHAFMMLRHGKIIAEGSFPPWSGNELHMLYSLSKSFTSTAVGFAVQEGLLRLSDRLVDFFPEHLPAAPCENMAKITLRHLLTMNTGHRVEPRMQGDCWEKTFLQSYVEFEPGTHFLYNTFATYMLAAVVQKVTGKKLLAWLREKLMDPLGMSGDIWFEESPGGVATGGYGLNVRVEDIARLGQFYLQGGRWEGRQLLNEQWIRDAQTAWSDNSISGNPNPDWTRGYGYQFWMCQPERVFRGDGAFGQYCVVLPEQDMVVAINSGVDDMQAVLQALWDHVLPCVGEPCAPAGRLEARLRGTATAAFWEEENRAVTAPVPEERWLGSYRLQPDNPWGLETLTLDADALRLVTDAGESRIPLRQDAWTPAALLCGGAEADPCGYYRKAGVRAARCGDELLVHICFVNTPFEQMLSLSFTEHGLQGSLRVNVGFTAREPDRLLGYREA